MNLNYAEQYSGKLLDMFIEKSYITPFVASNVEWVGAKDFHFTTMKTGGYKKHSRDGGWNSQTFEQEDHVYSVANDRDVEFFVDKANVDETNRTASIENISQVFNDTQVVPEVDAYFFSSVASKAIEKNLSQESTLATYTKENVLTKLKTFIAKVRRYKNKGLIVYVKPEIMDLLSLSTEVGKSINIEGMTDSPKGLQTRIGMIDGVILIEVIDDDRFYTEFDFTDGFKLSNNSKAINLLACTPKTTKYVRKIASLYLFLAGEHTKGDGALYQNRKLDDVFVFPNGKDGKIDSIFVDYDPTAVEVGE